VYYVSNKEFYINIGALEM